MRIIDRLARLVKSNQRRTLWVLLLPIVVKVGMDLLQPIVLKPIIGDGISGGALVVVLATGAWQIGISILGVLFDKVCTAIRSIGRTTHLEARRNAGRDARRAHSNHEHGNLARDPNADGLLSTGRHMTDRPQPNRHGTRPDHGRHEHGDRQARFHQSREVQRA